MNLDKGTPKKITIEELIEELKKFKKTDTVIIDKGTLDAAAMTWISFSIELNQGVI